MRRYLDAPNVGRECPGSKVLRSAFCRTVKRRQRRSDGTLSLAGKRFEIPDRYRHMDQPRVRYARWDLRSVELVDPHTQATLCPLYPLDKSANAQGLRRSRAPEQAAAVPAPQQDELPALLRKLLADYAATGRPPAYLPKPPRDPEDTS